MGDQHWQSHVQFGCLGCPSAQDRAHLEPQSVRRTESAALCCKSCCELSSALLQTSEEPWGGLWRSCGEGALAADAARLYTDQALWEGCAGAGARALPRLYDADARLGAVRAAVEDALADLGARRARDFTGGLLWQQGARATEFFARWVELKESRV